MELWQAIEGRDASGKDLCIGVVGSGGKTTTIQQLADSYSEYGRKVVITSLTQSANSDGYIILLGDGSPRDVKFHLRQRNPLTVMGAELSPEKLSGISVHQLERLQRDSHVCLFECDGARGQSLKAHLPHDPEIPQFATHAIIVVGADVVNSTIADGLVHRPDLFKSHWDVSDQVPLTIDMIAKVVTSSRGYLSKVPYSIPKIFFVNKADEYPDNAKQLAAAILLRSGAPTYFGSANDNTCEVAPGAKF